MEELSESWPRLAPLHVLACEILGSARDPLSIVEDLKVKKV